MVWSVWPFCTLPPVLFFFSLVLARVCEQPEPRTLSMGRVGESGLFAIPYALVPSIVTPARVLSLPLMLLRT